MTVTALEPDATARLDRRYLSDTYAELCSIDSPSGREGPIADHVIAELKAAGVTVVEDDSAVSAGSERGNLLARIPAHRADLPGMGSGIPASLLFAAGLDTGPPGDVHGRGARAALAVLLTLARHARREGLGLDLELLFTVCSRRDHAGAQALDLSALRSPFGYLLDHPGPIGAVVTGSPTLFRVKAAFRGAPEGGDGEPDDGRSAILAAVRAIASLSLPAEEEETKVSVGTISGGEAMDIAPEWCTVVAEVRGPSDEQAEKAVGELIDGLSDAANRPECECDLDVAVERILAASVLPPGSAAVRTARAALERSGHTSRLVAGGSSDAHALLGRGFTAVALSNGIPRGGEAVADGDGETPGGALDDSVLEAMLELSLGLCGEVVRSTQDAAG